MDCDYSGAVDYLYRMEMRMNAQCAVGIHDYKKVYPDQDLIDGIIFKQSIEEIWECTRCAIMTAAEGVIEQQMKEYAEKFGWDPKTDMWLWNGLGDCGIGYLIAVGNTTNAADTINRR